MNWLDKWFEKFLRTMVGIELWGTMTDYENDYHDRDKLKELIDELDEFMIESFDCTEAENKKKCSLLLGKIGRLLPNLWT